MDGQQIHVLTPDPQVVALAGRALGGDEVMRGELWMGSVPS